MKVKYNTYGIPYVSSDIDDDWDIEEVIPEKCDNCGKEITGSSEAFDCDTCGFVFCISCYYEHNCSNNVKKKNLIIKCQCGAEKIGSKIHSDWCVKYKKDDK
jgi:hypothetical protein